MSAPFPSPAEYRGVRNALSETLVHRLLVFSVQLAMLPSGAAAASLLLNALVVGFIWASTTTTITGIIAGLVMLGFGGMNALMLTQLPRHGKSWGSPIAPLLALSGVQALIIAIIGMFPAPLPFALLVGVAITAIAFYATWIEPFRVGVTHQTLSLSRPAQPGHSLRVLQVGDLHLERISPRERRVNALIESLKPDLILFSGDFVNISYTYDAVSERDIREVIGAWCAPLGVYVVPGTPHVEPMDRVIAFVRGLDGLHLLTNGWRSLETPVGTLHLLGLVTTHDLETDRAALEMALQQAPDTPGHRVLLTHSPDLAPEASEAGFTLYLCGHTHGGQIRLPFIGALLSASHYGRRFVMGRYALREMTLYITRGLGMEGFGAPRARFLCPPEVVLWEIKS